ncbi:hypothetical protein GQ44DRAFT_799768 [Phaeosphaeriaceae sp. PMI808]|nr:hypothetical protein GQ44DRAFT_799768 [Phaeosphaeriaceae sp. PMI808]
MSASAAAAIIGFMVSITFTYAAPMVIPNPNNVLAVVDSDPKGEITNALNDIVNPQKREADPQSSITSSRQSSGSSTTGLLTGSLIILLIYTRIDTNEYQQGIGGLMSTMVLARQDIEPAIDKACILTQSSLPIVRSVKARLERVYTPDKVGWPLLPNVACAARSQQVI